MILLCFVWYLYWDPEENVLPDTSREELDVARPWPVVDSIIHIIAFALRWTGDSRVLGGSRENTQSNSMKHAKDTVLHLNRRCITIVSATKKQTSTATKAKIRRIFGDLSRVFDSPQKLCVPWRDDFRFGVIPIVTRLNFWSWLANGGGFHVHGTPHKKGGERPFLHGSMAAVSFSFIHQRKQTGGSKQTFKEEQQKNLSPYGMTSSR